MPPHNLLTRSSAVARIPADCTWHLAPAPADPDGRQLILTVSAHLLGIDMARTPRLRLRICIDGANIDAAAWLWPAWGNVPAQETAADIATLPLWALARIFDLATAAAKASGEDMGEWRSGQIVLSDPRSAKYSEDTAWPSGFDPVAAGCNKAAP